MKCSCGGRTSVLDSRGNLRRGAIRRRRQCDACGARSTSYEIQAERLEVHRTLVMDLSQQWPKPNDGDGDGAGLIHSVARPIVCNSTAELAGPALTRWAEEHRACIDGSGFCGETACALALGALPIAELRAERDRLAAAILATEKGT